MKLRRIVAIAQAAISTLTGISRAGLTPKVVKPPAAERILVLAPHADDETIGCGGIIKQYNQAGKFVEVIILTDGRLGDPDIRAMPDSRHRLECEAKLIELRRQEAQRAADILGVSKLTFLDAYDSRLEYFEADFLDALLTRYDATNPDIVFVPFFLDAHPDHRAANSCLDALYRQRPSSQHVLCAAYEIWSPLAANTLVNISSQASAKWQAIGQYNSQLKDVDYLKGIQGLNRYRAMTGFLPDGAYAEAFFISPITEYLELYRQYLNV